jgi:hypothetical protein
MNIKRGLKRIWVVGSVVLVIVTVFSTIDEFPEKPNYLYEDKNPSKEKLEIYKELEYLSKKEHGKDYDYNKETKKEYVKEILRIPLLGLGGLVFMWGLLYTGFWIFSGFSSDKKKDETNET